MEKVCEFCRVGRPVVYCQADAAQLCLSCDAKVHSANALSSRHLRSLLCDSCHFRPASLHCSASDHNVYTCTSCDKALHSVLPQHQRQPIDSYIGCPSVKDFADLWDLDLNHVTGAADNSSFMSKNHQQDSSKILERKQQPTRSLVQQIMELKKLQLNDHEDGSGKEDNGMSSSSSLTNAAAMKRKTVTEGTVHSDFVKNHPLDQKNLNGEPFPTAPFTLESLQSSVEGDSFWQCRIQTNQFLAQNMQDLGVCEDLSRDDFNIPDVDVTFQNYEELFGGDSNHNNEMLSVIGGLEEENAPASSYYNISSSGTDHFGPSSGQFVTTREDGTKRYKDKKEHRMHEKKTPHLSSGNADVRKRAIEGEVKMQRFRYH